jgi:hypothetical protein
MARSRYALTPAVSQLIVSYVRAGGYPQVAAEAAGVPREVFAVWLRRGTDPGGRSLYRDLLRDVVQAHAQARLKAEVAALEDRPLDWLKFGPGKETHDAPGWTGLARPRPAPESADDNPLGSAAARKLFHYVLELLTPLPQFREDLARELYGKSESQTDSRRQRRGY